MFDMNQCPICGRITASEQCPCGWLFIADPMECLAHPNIGEHQRKLIETELQAVAQTGPREKRESKKKYQARVGITLEKLLRINFKERFEDGTTDPTDTGKKYRE
jgi:hypothetical protein